MRLNRIINILWRSNRQGFVKIFEQRNEGDVYQKAYSQAEEKS